MMHLSVKIRYIRVTSHEHHGVSYQLLDQKLIRVIIGENFKSKHYWKAVNEVQ